MGNFMRRYQSQTYAIFRIVVGFLFLWHGMQKLFGVPGTLPGPMPAFIVWIAGPIEFLGGILVMLGLFTREAAFLASGLMAFAYWMAHGPQGLLPVLNGGEPAVFYCFAFLLISAQGAGIWSIDAARGGRDAVARVS
jgi:putative oxidoreductase